MSAFTGRNCVSHLRSKSGAFVRSLLTDLDGRNSHVRGFRSEPRPRTVGVLKVATLARSCAHGGWGRAACQRCRWKVLGVLALFVLNRRHEDLVDAFSVHVDDLKTQTVPLKLFRL